MISSVSAPLLPHKTPTRKPSLVFRHPVKQAPQEEISFFAGLRNAFTETHLNWLLVFVPLGFIAQYGTRSEAFVFISNFFAIIPLAGLLGKATEEIGCRSSQALAGLLNATFGNAVELIVSIIALQRNLLDVVKANLLGSIISNLLLVFGTACFLGGLRNKIQKFSAMAAGTASGLLFLSVLGILVPASILAASDGDPERLKAEALHVSRYSAVVLLVVYFAFLFFQLRTHADVFSVEEEEEEPEEATMTLASALLLLAADTVAVSFCGDFLVGSIQAVSEQFGISRTFIGLILIPIIGNAAEHATAITAAMKNKMNLTIAVVVGSCTQIAMSVIPFCVVVGWIIGRDLGLDFRTEESMVLFISTILSAVITQDGQTNWLEGLMLTAAYVIIAICFFFHQVPV